MKLAIRCLAAASVFLAVGSVAHAEPTISDYQKLDRKNGPLPTYISGLGQAYLWANVALRAEQAQRLYCPPPTLVINLDNYYSILDSYIKENNTPGGDALGMTLLMALRKTFPCK
ncbi:hypothetical protein [Paraburkholderia susongensis]|uniref:hypothetical protein n=1 Tax=Paraburkholderia susongensis TaxID=1515439 RepID=UPI0011814FCF|nr:hypothetical protein [Paraburkholderia susongensis]